ncbi:hypothetical protein GCM10027175_07320 [Hymenobacter latericoloratus]
MRYEWTTSGPGLQVAYLTGNGSQVRVTAPASGSFDATVQVRAYNDVNSCAASNPATYRFRVGNSATPAEIFINGYYPTSNGQYVPPQPCGTVYFQLMNGSPADVTGVVWTTDGTIISGQGSGVVQIRFPDNAVYGSAVARFTNACGTSDGILATVPFREECYNGGGPPRDCIDCEVYGFRSAYPNPADQELVLEQAAGAPTLYNSYGQPVRQLNAQSGTLRLPTHDLPAGIYYLEVRSPAKGYKRLRVRIQH